MGRKKKVKENDLLEAIKGSRGFYSTIAARLHVNWHAVENAVRDSVAAQEAIKAEEETTLDFVEGKAIQRINDGDGAMIRFYLATKGKRRGYTYEEEPPHADENDDEQINVTVNGEPITPGEPDQDTGA